MQARLQVNQDSIAGLLFVAFGVAGLWIGRDYAVGTAVRMGPGYFPKLLSWLLVLFGLGIGLRGALVGGAAIAQLYLRPVFFVLISFIAFGLLIDRLGLPAAALACVFIGAMGGSEFRWKEQVVLSISLAIAASALFIFALGLPMQLWPR